MPSKRRRRGRSPSADLKMVRAIRGVTPAFSTCRRPLHRRLVESEKPTASPQRSPKLTDRSFDLEIHRRCFAAVFFDLILNLLPLVERAQSSTLDRRDVDEHVPAAPLRLNESIALGRIEPLYRAARHCPSPN